MQKRYWFGSIVAAGLVGGAAALGAASQVAGHMPPAWLHGGARGQGAGDAACPLAGAIHAHLQQLHAELNLSDAQRQAVRDTFQAHRAELAAAVRPVLQAKQTLMNAVHTDASGDAAIRTAADAFGRSVGDAAVVVARVKREVLQAAALTPEQNERLTAIQARVDTAINHLLDTLQPPAENPR